MTKNKTNKIAAIAAGMLLLNLPAAPAAAEEEHYYTLDQIVVTATRTEKKVKDIPAGITVITAEDLKKQNIRTLDDALLHVPGVYIKGQRGMKATKISIRGLSQNRVLVLLDGQPLNNGYTGGTQWANIPIDNIERIEVIRGPFSALYGSSAMGGVVNIITRENAPPQTFLTTGAGEQGTRLFSFGHNDQDGKLEYYLNYAKKETDGYTLNPATPGDGDFGWDNEQHSAKFIYHLNETDQLSVSTSRSDHSYQYDVKTDRGQRVTEMLNLRYQGQLAPDKQLTVRWSELDFSDYWTVSGSNFSPNPAKTREAEVSMNWELSPRHTLTFGAATKIDKCDGQTFRLSNPAVISRDDLREQSGGKTSTDSFYLQDEMSLNPQTTLYVGGRYDQWKFHDGYNVSGKLDDKEESSFSPKASLVYKQNDRTSWYLSGGKSFSSPTIFNLARRWDVAASLLLPNPELKPEKATSYEFGINHQATASTAVKLSVFRNNITDMIYQAYIRDLSATKKEYQWRNAGEAEITGVELEVDHRFSPNVSGYANYTHNDPEITANSDASLVGKQVPTVPKDTFSLGLTYEQKKLTANMEGRYVARTYESDKNTEVDHGYGSFEPHFVVDTKLTYRFTGSTSLALSVYNLLDRKYYQESLAPERSVLVELTQKF